MPMTAHAMPPHDSLSAEPAPLPKINVPPPLEVVRPQNSGMSEEPTTPASREGRKSVSAASGIRWDARFALSLIALLVLVNATLALLFARPAPPKRADFVTQLAAPAPTLPKPPAVPAAAPALGALAPASGTAPKQRRMTTTYISREERKALLEQLQRTRQPGVVSRPPLSGTEPR